MVVQHRAQEGGIVLEARAEFSLSPEVHLNHGSFGAVPRSVAAAQAQVRVEQGLNFHRFYEQPALRF